MVPTIVALVTWALATRASGNATSTASNAVGTFVFLITANPQERTDNTRGRDAPLPTCLIVAHYVS
jgi:hypothetical protein